jgi:hypothetical protein
VSQVRLRYCPSALGRVPHEKAAILSEHSVAIIGLFWNCLFYVPVFDYQAVINTENVNNGASPVVDVGRVNLAMIVDNHEAAFGNHSLNLTTEICFLDVGGKPCDKSCPTVSAIWVVLDVFVG